MCQFLHQTRKAVWPYFQTRREENCVMFQAWTKDLKKALFLQLFKLNTAGSDILI